MSEEHKVYIPLQGKHITPGRYEFTARWYAEQGRPIKPDTRLKKFARGMRRTVRRVGIECYREDDERCLRIGRLFISWYSS